MTQILLTPTEARVVAALAEKSIATPQYYPMSVNAIMLACNQKTSRSPVMSLTEGDVGAALNSLESEKFVSRDQMSTRVTKWRHHLHHQLLLKEPQLAVLITLLLRGPLTVSELRASASGLGGPADSEGILAVLADLADRAQPLAALLPRAPGQKEARYAHLLSGAAAPAVSSPAPASVAEAPVARRNPEPVAALEQRLADLEQRVTDLERRLAPGQDLSPESP